MFDNFTEKDVNPVLLEESIQREVINISKQEGREYDESYKKTRQSHIAERFLIEHYGYKNNPKKWHDLISPEGYEVEVKTTKKIYTEAEEKNFVRNLLQAHIDYNDAKIVYLFRVDENGVYSFYKKYDLDEEKKNYYFSVINERVKVFQRVKSPWGFKNYATKKGGIFSLNHIGTYGREQLEELYGREK